MKVLKYGSQGAEVKKYKDMLVALGYLHKSTHNFFGLDTDRAVRAFQRAHKDQYGRQLVVDGKIGELTAWALNKAYKERENLPTTPVIRPDVLNPSDYPQIPAAILKTVNSALQDETQARQVFIKEALRWAYPYCIYIIGANLYDTKKNYFKPTKAYIEARAKARPDYFTNGRKAWMIAEVEKAAKAKARLSAADCSGFIVGLNRYLELKTADKTAHGIYHDWCKGIKKSELRPGDFVFRRNSSGRIVHVGIYIGGGYTIEAAGGAYGVQITGLDTRQVKNHVKGKTEKLSAWNVYGRPSYLL